MMDRVVKSAGRVLEIFEYFAHRQSPATVSEVANALEYPISSTSVLLKSLLSMGYLEYLQDTRSYLPTIRFGLLGTWMFERLFSDEEPVLHLMDELQLQTSETIVLAMKHGWSLDYIRVLQSIAPVRFEIRPGSRRPIWLPATGKVLLAQLTDEAVTGLLRRVNSEPENKRVEIKPFLKEMAQVRRQGYAISEGSVVPDTAMFAMALSVQGSHRPLSVAVSGPLERMRRNQEKTLSIMKQTLKDPILGARRASDASSADAAPMSHYRQGWVRDTL
jgi:DNA-binding IclR family transcriptional regulator